MGNEIVNKTIPIVPDTLEKEMPPMRAGAVDKMLTWNGLFFTGNIYLYAYVRDDSGNVCIDFYFVNSPLNEDRKFRAIVKNGYRLERHKELILKKLSRQGVIWDKTNKEQFLNGLRKRRVFLPPDVERIDSGILLDYVYACFSRNKSKTTLYSKGLYTIGSEVEFFLGINEAGETPEEIIELPMPLLKMYEENYRSLESFIYPGKRKEASELYKRFSTDIGDTVPTLFQYKYLEEINEFSNGIFDKDIFDSISAYSPEETGNKLENLSFPGAYDRFKRFCRLKDKVSDTCHIEHIPNKNDFDNVMEVLETAFQYKGSETYIKNRLLQLYDDRHLYSNDRYMIVPPKDLNTFLVAELLLKNNVLPMLYSVLQGNSIVLFIYSATSPNEPLCYIDLEGYQIYHIHMKLNKKAGIRIVSFVKEYAKTKGFTYNPEGDQ